MFGDIMKKESKSTKETGHSFEDYFKRAVNPMLVLEILSERSMYVYEMANELEKRSNGQYTISLLYPVIYRLASHGFVREGPKAISEDNRVRQYYEITPEGTAYLHQYSRYVTIVGMKKMSKAQGLHRYLRTISRKLVCYKDTKQTLLEGLEQELSVYSSLSYDELCQEIGNPTQVSAQLMENISEQEIAYMKRRRKMILCTVSICFVIAFALAVFYFVHAQSVMRGDFYVQEHNTVESDTFVSSGTLDDN